MTSPETARSALTLRLVLAGFGLVTSLVLGVLALAAGATVAGYLLVGLAGAAAVDLVVVTRRRRDRARAHQGADHRHDSLFE